MNLSEWAREVRKARRREAEERDPAALPEHLAAQQRLIEQGFGYPTPPDMPGARDGWTR